MGEDCESKKIEEMHEMLDKIKDIKFINRLHAIIKLQIEKENEESNIS